MAAVAAVAAVAVQGGLILHLLWVADGSLWVSPFFSHTVVLVVLSSLDLLSSLDEDSTLLSSEEDSKSTGAKWPHARSCWHSPT
jgi:hypothetical protein